MFVTKSRWPLVCNKVKLWANFRVRDQTTFLLANKPNPLAFVIIGWLSVVISTGYLTISTTLHTCSNDYKELIFFTDSITRFMNFLQQSATVINSNVFSINIQVIWKHSKHVQLDYMNKNYCVCFFLVKLALKTFLNKT